MDVNKETNEKASLNSVLFQVEYGINLDSFVFTFFTRRLCRVSYQPNK